LAAEIPDLFPTIAALEQLKVHKEETSGMRVSLGVLKLERLGDFRILGEIGRGGMGIVFEAFQESLSRHVAVEVLPKQSLLNPQHLQRFQRESQTAARLHHTNIVPVFGIGEQEGFHYIVMQLIQGVGLDLIIGELRRIVFRQAATHSECDQAPPRSRSTSKTARLAEMLLQGHFWQTRESLLSSSELDEIAKPEEGKSGAAFPTQASSAVLSTADFQINRGAEVSRSRDSSGQVSTISPLGPGARRISPLYWQSVAAIGLQVAEALHYAHGHHTLHRDIKPANLLLDSQSVVWITDFGLAKAMEQDNVTQTGALVGTWRYMAPEQFSGRCDVRSDIYSLGLTLYELLTLQPAFEDTDRSTLIRKITQDEPIRPRKLNPAVPRDLETIILKAISRDPAQRYQTAGELARDF
jgi:serine/threonine protein kinase